MREINWIKEAVRVCITNDLTENDKKSKFEELRKQYEMFSDEEKNNISSTIKARFSVNDSIYIYSEFLYYVDNKHFAESMIDAVLDSEFDACTGAMLELQTARYAESFKSLYKKRRILHRKNIEKFEQILQIKYPYIQAVNRNSKRIVIVTEQILSIKHSPTRMLLYFVYILKKMGYEILLFSCPSEVSLPQHLYNHAIIMNANKKYHNVPIRISFRDEIIEEYQINMSMEPMKEYYMMLSLIYYFNPAFVFDFGTANPIVDLAGRFTTLVSMEMSVTCPVSEGQILVRLDRTEEELEKEYEEVLLKNQKQFFLKEKFPVIIEPFESNWTRTDIGLPEGRFLAVIVGNRLDMEINDAFIRAMGTMLKNIPSLDFVVIGITETMKQQLTDKIFENRVYFLGYQDELMKVYSVLDLYLNLERTGGGFSAAMALIAGMPVVTFPNCDVAYNVGEEFVVKDYEEMVHTVARYVEDREFYDQKAKAAKHYKEENTDIKLKKFAQKFLDGVLKLIDEGEKSNAGV